VDQNRLSDLYTHILGVVVGLTPVILFDSGLSPITAVILGTLVVYMILEDWWLSAEIWREYPLPPAKSSTVCLLIYLAHIGAVIISVALGLVVLGTGRGWFSPAMFGVFVAIGTVMDLVYEIGYLKLFSSDQVKGPFVLWAAVDLISLPLWILVSAFVYRFTFSAEQAVIIFGTLTILSKALERVITGLFGRFHMAGT